MTSYFNDKNLMVFVQNNHALVHKPLIRRKKSTVIQNYLSLNELTEQQM